MVEKQSSPKEPELIEQIKRIVEDTIRVMLPRTDQLRALNIEKIAMANSKLLTGNGDPEKGLVYQFQEMKSNVKDVKEDIEEVKRKIGRIEYAAWSIVFLVLAWVVSQVLGLIPLHP